MRQTFLFNFLKLMSVIRGGAAELQQILDGEKSLYSLRQTFRSFFSNISILLMLLVNGLFIVSLFFNPLALNRVIVEAALFVGVFVFNMWLYYLQDKHLVRQSPPPFACLSLTGALTVLIWSIFNRGKVEAPCTKGS